MAKDSGIALQELLQQDEAAILQSWVDAQVTAPGFRSDRLTRNELTDQSRRLLALLPAAVGSGTTDIHAPEWSGVRHMLEELSRARAHQGFSPSDTATFVFSLKQPLFDRLRAKAGKDVDAFANGTWEI